ncbi:acyltransferase family protein [Rhodococcus sovatensis]|uniref:Acyltransferase family protein n=1 Tax=Rhodococcus sovatensis TaxID=1805840 RepID=A0ABZ2PML4_9NOCA
MPAPYQPAGVSVGDVPGVAQTAPRPPLREDLNGLRGVAIALVVVFHVWMGRVSGGVDVFLVLTGFFFTASLIRTAQSGGSLNPFTRIGRVLRRLGPPLVLVLVGVAVATALLLPRTRWVDIANQVVSGVFFYANWELAWTSQDYLAADPSVSPLQHLWSVAVQFQFYLVAIVVVFGLAGVLRRSRGVHRASPPPHVYLVLFAGASLVSFVYAADGTSRLQSWNYYDTGARLWEILLGGAVAALFAARHPRPTHERRSSEFRTGRTALAVLGLAAVVACGFLLDGVNEFPGPWALFPVLATIALIAAGPDTSVGHLLRSRFGLWLGSIAFPLYLWHWPLLIFTLAYSGKPSADLATGAAIIAASVVLAMATVRLVEKPLQAPGGSIPRIAITATAAVLAAALVCGSAGWNFYIQRSVSDLQASDELDPFTYPGARELTDGATAPDADVVPALFSAPEDLPVTSVEGCIADFETRDAISCEYGDLSASRTIALAGSSHAEHWVTALDMLGRDRGFRVVTFLKMGCPLTLGTMPMLGESEYPDCLDWTQTVMSEVEQLGPDYVFTTSTRPREGGQGDYTPDFYVNVWNELTSYGIPILAMRDTPWLVKDGVVYRAIDCLADGGSAMSCGMPRGAALDPINPTLASSFRLPTVRPLDLTSALCDGPICPAVVGNVLVYRDEHHLTATYVRTLTSELGREIAASTGWW